MELREIKEKLNKSDKKLKELWRSLWHWQEKRTYPNFRGQNQWYKFLEWERKCWKDNKRIKHRKRYSRKYRNFTKTSKG